MTENNKNSVLNIEAENGIIDDVATMSINSSDAYPNTSATAVALGLNDWGAGCFCCPDDAVWFKFTPSTTKYYTIRSDGSLDVMAQLYNSSNVLLNQADDEGPGMNFRMATKLTAGQTYYIKVTAFGTVGAFNIIVSDFVYVESVTIDQEEITINRGNSYNLSTTILPDGATNKNLYWQSGNTNVATVDSNGKVTAVSGGETCICAYSQDGSNKYSCCVVRVKIPVAYVTVSEPTKTMYVGQSDYVKATAFPGNASNRTLRWSSSNSNIASVDPITGYVTAKSVGTVYIYATAQDGTGEQGVCTITVESPIPVQGLQLGWESFSLDVGETDVLDYAVLPANATNKAVTWRSSNPNVVEINASTGLMTAKKADTAIITGTTMDGGFSANCVVTVNPLLIYQTRDTEVKWFDPDVENAPEKIREDMLYNHLSKEEIKENVPSIDDSMFENNGQEISICDRKDSLVNMATTYFAFETFDPIITDMINHFMCETRTNFNDVCDGYDLYFNSSLTEQVKNHSESEIFINKNITALNQCLKNLGGNIYNLKYNPLIRYDENSRESHPFVAMADSMGINLPVFDDTLTGFRICIDSLQGAKIEILSYNLVGNSYSGEMKITYYDHFGLDVADLNKSGFSSLVGDMTGFKNWFILQHYNNLNTNIHPKPFVTMIEIEESFSGEI